ncbi:hypothetical protein [Pseudorhodoferax sp.]|uniref:hypothetical protein n=1 Tax=Pseudorhodoferax sp. TaxID=1993553 RepID=UPI002DD62E06|nr:hypothetical protein [Pseudorhodoferax sp.]
MNDVPHLPPRYVPVLTEIVGADARVEPVPVAVPAPAPTPAAMETLEDQLIHRVMQRVDVALERDLHDAVASMVLQHTHALVPRLREEIEFVVRQAVAEAVAAELAQRPTA